ncbi:M23 family metallopeptidase [Solwaraspora sp. WMMB335]|uniref:M23 family metallopeptidase n=1 Tax=Solwaraspora sp. WMMB335 TaxID=3404118 RepID=UPI003B93E539
MSAGTDTSVRTRAARHLALTLALTATLVLLCCTGGIGAVLFSDDDSDSVLFTSFGCGQDGPVDLSDGMPSIGPYGPDQIANAAVIINVGVDMSVPPRGWVVAVATAMQESALRNLPHLGERNDHDSVGLFQQRPSQGWGTPEQLQDPAYSSRKFYQKMLTVDGWETMTLTDTAQRVQVSAFPDAYAKHEPLATQIVNALTGGAARAVLGADGLRCAAGAEIAASGWTRPVPGNVGSGFRTSSRPGHNGVDIAQPKGTLIRSAAAGRVIVSRCDPDHNGRLNCNVDGSPSTGGCGWFVDILHADQVITRYCHMVSRPDVGEGDLVDAGQVIGKVGSSGNSSGPHLHYEVHLRGDRSSRGAVDPVAFMRDRGAPLGERG